MVQSCCACACVCVCVFCSLSLVSPFDMVSTESCCMRSGLSSSTILHQLKGQLCLHLAPAIWVTHTHTYSPRDTFTFPLLSCLCMIYSDWVPCRGLQTAQVSRLEQCPEDVSLNLGFPLLAHLTPVSLLCKRGWEAGGRWGGGGGCCSDFSLHI